MYRYLEAITSRLETIASRLAIAIWLEAIASKLEAIAIRLEAIALRLEAIASRLEAIAIRWVKDKCQSAWRKHLEWKSSARPRQYNSRSLVRESKTKLFRRLYWKLFVFSLARRTLDTQRTKARRSTNLRNEKGKLMKCGRTSEEPRSAVERANFT